MEGLIGGSLRLGVIASAGLFTIGTLWNALLRRHPATDYTIQGQTLLSFALAQVSQIFHAALDPQLLLNLGLILLLLTPFLRVAVSVLYFAMADRNWKYTLIGSCVLAVLSYRLLVN